MDPLFFAACAASSALFGGIGGILRLGMPDVFTRLTRAGTTGLAFESLRKECGCPRWELGLVLMALINKRKVGWDFSVEGRQRTSLFPYPFPWHFRLCTFRHTDDTGGYWEGVGFTPI